MRLAVVVLRVHDDDQVAEDAERPDQRAGGDGHLESARVEQLLHQVPVGHRETLVQVGDALRTGESRSVRTGQSGAGEVRLG